MINKVSSKLIIFIIDSSPDKKSDQPNRELYLNTNHLILCYEKNLL